MNYQEISRCRPLLLCAVMVAVVCMTSCKQGKPVAHVVEEDIMVQGVVCDATNHHAHPQAKVLAINMNNDTVVTVTTDFEGKFIFVVPKGVYSLHVKTMGYNTEKRWLNAYVPIYMDTIYIESLPPGVIEVDEVLIAAPRDSILDDCIGPHSVIQKTEIDGVKVSVQ